MLNNPYLILFVAAVVEYVGAEFQNPYPPLAALFGPRNNFICNAIVLRRGQILTSADCLYLKKNGTYSRGVPGDFHVALETHSIERLHNGKAFGGKSSRRKYLEKLSQKFGAKYDNKYANGVFSDKLKPAERNYLSKALRSSGLVSKIERNYVPVLSFKVHPEFKGTFENDLALLNISDRYPAANSSIAEASQSSIEMAFNRTVQVYGFGILSHGANEMNRPSYFKVRSVEMQLLPPSGCQHDFGNLFNSAQHLCMKAKSNETLCWGFTGAPILLDGKLIGFVDFGQYSCSLDSPVVGIRLDTFANFLGLPAPTVFDSFWELIQSFMGIKL